MALQDQKLKKELSDKQKLEDEIDIERIDNILQFKKPEKNMGGLISLIS